MKPVTKTLATLALTAPLAACTSQSDERPNVVLFLIDDLGWLDTSVAFGEECYPFNLRHDTPNIQRLSDEGAIMTSAYVCPVSTPTRTSIMSGMNAAHTRITNYTSVYKDWNPDATDTPSAQESDVLNRTEWNVNGITPIEREDLTRSVHVTPYPQLLKDAGYYTIHVGKGHWAPGGTPAANPHNMGFCVNVAGQIAGKPRSYYGEENYGNTSEAWNFFSVQNMAEYYGSGTHLTEALTLEALKTLDYPIERGIPFYLNFCHHAVHTPIHRDPRFFDKYAERGMDEGQARFASMVEGVDKSLGDLMAYLEAKGVADNTVVIFLSDNGGNSENLSKGGVRHTQNSPLREGKGSCYEAGIRVPMIVWWPKRVAGGVRLNTPAMAEDIFPTVLAMAGVEGYKTVQELDGKNLVPLLTDGSQYVKQAMVAGEITSQQEANRYVVPESISGIDPERVVTAHFPHQWKPYQLDDIDYLSSVRQGDWKLVYRHRTQALELYNIGEDVTERNDLSASHPEKVHELAVVLSERLRGWDALMPTIRATGKPVPMPDEVAKANI